MMPNSWRQYQRALEEADKALNPPAPLTYCRAFLFLFVVMAGVVGWVLLAWWRSRS